MSLEKKQVGLERSVICVLVGMHTYIHCIIIYYVLLYYELLRIDKCYKLDLNEATPEWTPIKELPTPVHFGPLGIVVHESLAGAKKLYAIPYHRCNTGRGIWYNGYNG